MKSNKEIYYIGVDFENDYGECIKSYIKNPKKKQIKKFLNKDLKLYHTKIEDFYPVTREYAEDSYDMSNEVNWPILK